MAISSFEQSYFERIKIMARYIYEGSSILDLGCGPMWLRNILPRGCKYYPVDFIRRSADTIVCDFNKKQFPSISVDIAFCSGIFEYVENPHWFVKQICRYADHCIISYNSSEYTTLLVRKGLGWVNSFSFQEVAEIFEFNNYELDDSQSNYNQTGEHIYHFTKS